MPATQQSIEASPSDQDQDLSAEEPLPSALLAARKQRGARAAGTGPIGG